MASEVINTALDAEMSDCDKVVTMIDVLKEQEDFEEDANAVLGASDDKNCTYSKGYIKRQAIYACLTCCSDAKSDPTKRAGVCLACSLTCHENHELVELYTKRNFRCDCGNPKFNSHPCQYTPNKSDLNNDNNYNQNFSGLYCICQRPYPDPESTVEDEMIQCIICEDWLHALHLEAAVPANDQYSEMICKGCMEKNDFLHDYSDFTVNAENINDAIHIVNGVVSHKSDVCDENSQILEITNATNEGKSSNTNMVISDNSMEDNKKSIDHNNTADNNILDKNKLPKDNDLKTFDSLNKSVNGSTPAPLNTVELKESHLNNESNVQTTSEESRTKDIANSNNEDILGKDSRDQVDTMMEISEEDLSNTNDKSNKPDFEDNSNLKEVAHKFDNNKENEDKESTMICKQNENIVKITETARVDSDKDEDAAKSVEQEEENRLLADPEEELKNSTIGETDKKDKCSEENLDSNEAKSYDSIIITEKSAVLFKTTVENNSNMTNEPVNSGELNENNLTLSDLKENPDKNVLENNSIEEKIALTDEESKDQNMSENQDSSKIVNVTDENPHESDDKLKFTMEHSTEETVTNTDKISEKRKYSTEETTDTQAKKKKLDDNSIKLCIRPKKLEKVRKGATFWPSTFRQKLCTCKECTTMYKDLSVLFLIDPEDTVTAYENLGKEIIDGKPSSQYEKGLQALSSLDRMQQINALTEYNKMRDKLIDFFKSFKERNEIVKEEDIKTFFAGMKPKREPDGVYFCR